MPGSDSNPGGPAESWAIGLLQWRDRAGFEPACWYRWNQVTVSAPEITLNGRLTEAQSRGPLPLRERRNGLPPPARRHLGPGGPAPWAARCDATSGDVPSSTSGHPRGTAPARPPDRNAPAVLEAAWTGSPEVPGTSPTAPAHASDPSDHATDRTERVAGIVVMEPLAIGRQGAVSGSSPSRSATAIRMVSPWLTRATPAPSSSPPI